MKRSLQVKAFKAPDFPSAEGGYGKLPPPPPPAAMNHPPGGRDDAMETMEMEDRDMNRCEAPSSDSGYGDGAQQQQPIHRTIPSPSPIYETRVSAATVDELTVNTMHDSPLPSSLSSSASGLDRPAREQRTGLRAFELDRPHIGQSSSKLPSGAYNDLSWPLQLRGEIRSSTQHPPTPKVSFSGGGLSLREWIRPGISRRTYKSQGLQLFRQIVELVDFAHSQDIILQDLRPSRFILLPPNKVKYVGTFVRRGGATQAAATNSDPERKRLRTKEEEEDVIFKACPITTSKHHKTSQELEEEWYTGPEDCGKIDCGISSNIYSLGVLLFELFCSFESWDAHRAAMSDLQLRILPPAFLSENPKESGFCLWFLHPDQSSRPTTREILQSDLFRVPFEFCHAESAAMPVENNEELELLLHFLASLKEQKTRDASKLKEDIMRIEEDLKEIHRTSFPMKLSLPSLPSTEGTRWMRSISQLEQSYFSMRSRSQPRVAEASPAAMLERDLFTNHRENSSRDKSSNQLGPFFEALCKFARYSKFEVRGTLKCGDLLNTANVIRSIGFDRDEEYVATAGVSKKIKVFEFSALLDDSIDIHYPSVEMSNRSKLSCICWNSYMKSFLASTDYDGLVQIWDVVTARSLSQYGEHQKRAWSVDFSQADPSRFASGSDDYSVKLWRINERNSIATIWSPANVCCVQFSAHSANLLALGCADNNIYCYDLRNTLVPWRTLSGHSKTVSYVKFLDFETLVSASTDNTLKKWDLNRRSSDSEGVSSNCCTMTFEGHTNEKNFVGLSVLDGYIACGSETNEVFSFYKSLPVPITSHKFGPPVEPASDIEYGSDDRHFVSSVCWGRRSNLIAAANSAGCLKVLQMV